MKLTLTGLAFLSQTFAVPDTRKLGQTRSMLAIKLGITEQESKKILKGYGCYCYAQGQTSVGPAYNYHGAPLDELDQLCKKLYKSEKCIDIDSNNGFYPKSCAIDQGTRFSESSPGQVTCDDDQNKCKIAMCEIENDFSGRVADLIRGGFAPDENNRVDWDDEAGYRAKCPYMRNGGGDGLAPPAMECCGEGLNRMMFNPLVAECCDGKASSPGSC